MLRYVKHKGILICWFFAVPVPHKPHQTSLLLRLPQETSISLPLRQCSFLGATLSWP